jgi:hypothetical protein
MLTTKRITEESFEAFLKCARKSHLVSRVRSALKVNSRGGDIA